MATPKPTTPVTFYLIRPDGQVPMDTKTIYWPSHLESANAGRKIVQSSRDSLKNIVFTAGSYTTSNEEQIQFLENYHIGGFLADGTEYPATPQNLFTITKEDPYAEKVRDREVEVKVEVTKQVIPRILAETLTPEQLATTCASYSIDISQVEHTRAALIKLLESKGYIV